MFGSTAQSTTSKVHNLFEPQATSTVLYQMAPSDIFTFFTDYDTKSNYTPPVNILAAPCTSNWCFLTFKHFSERILATTSIYVGWQSTVLKGAKYGKAVIHKHAKRQSIRPVASGLQFKCRWLQLKGFKRLYSDNNHLPSLKTFHFDEIIVHC